MLKLVGMTTVALSIVVLLGCGESEAEREALALKFQYVEDILSKTPMDNSVVPGRDGLKEFRAAHSDPGCEVILGSDETFAYCDHSKPISNELSAEWVNMVMLMDGKNSKIESVRQLIQIKKGAYPNYGLTVEYFNMYWEEWIKEIGEPDSYDKAFNSYSWLFKKDGSQPVVLQIRIMPERDAQISFMLILRDLES